MRRIPLPVYGAGERRPTWPLTLVGILIAFGAPELIRFLLREGGGVAFSASREAWWWLIAATVLLYVRFVEARSLASIGLARPTWSSAGVGIATALLLFAGIVATYALIFPALGLTMNREATAGIIRNPIWFQLLIAFRAAVVEEILYRGYPISRIAESTGSMTLAILVSVIVFTAAHVGYWGGAQLLIVAPAAVVLALLFAWRRDLVCNMVAHFLVDAAGFLAASAQS